jgi:hypothetical protein
MGIPILRGRPFTAGDRWPGNGVVLINQAMARRFWPNEDPIGRRIELVDRQPVRQQCEIVGIVADGKYLTLNESPAPYVYLPFEQQPVGEVTMIVRTRGAPSAAMEDFRRELRALDPAMPAMQIVTLDQHMKMALIFERTAAILVGTLGGLALILALAGLYGVMSSIAARRTREIGIRMALGARRRRILAQFVVEAIALSLLGGILGVLLGAGVAYAAREIVQIPASVPTWAVILSLASATGCGIVFGIYPAVRASRLDPVEAMRTE